MSTAPAKAAPAPVAAAKPVAPLTEAELVAITAEKIYTQFMTTAVAYVENKPTLRAPAEDLAKLSFDLAHAFHKAADSRKVVAVPTEANFDANMCDFDAWSVKPAG